MNNIKVFMLMAGLTAFPRQRELPLVDAERTRESIAELGQVVGASDDERELAATNIRAAAAYYGVEISTDAGGFTLMIALSDACAEARAIIPAQGACSSQFIAAHPSSVR